MWFKLVVVGLKAAGQKPKTAEVFCSFSTEKCPAVHDAALAQFCWPLGPENQTPKEFMAPEEFSFTLTQGDGSRLQGFCRRFLPPAPRVGSRLRFPQVLCLVCQASWSALFFKVLEVTEQLLRQTDILSDFSHKQLPVDSLAGAFLSNLGNVLAQQPELGSVIKIELPRISFPLAMSPPKRIGGAAGGEPLPLLLTEEFIELQVPPDAGNGAANAGVSLARLLWHVPVPAMVTLIASLLLERRVLVVGQSRDMVSAAVLAAQALIHPFRWHHIFLPLLPRSLSDYLTAPMPFLIGMPAQLLPAMKHLPMDEITLIDLDLGKCEPAPGSARDDAWQLPWREQLESALHAAFSLLKSPTEHESNPVIAGIMHGYFLKLLGNYRTHVYPEGSGPSFTAQPASSPSPNGMPHHQRSRSASPMQGGGNSSNALAAFAAAAVDKGPASHVGAASSGGSSRRQSRASSSNVGPAPDEGMKGHGYWFDHSSLVAAHRRNERARNFLMLLRQSQLFEVFVRERLEMYATVPGGPACSGDPFEALVNTYVENRSKRLSACLGAGVRSSLSRFGALMKKHRRTESSQSALSSVFSSSGASAGADHGSASASGGFASGLMSGLSRGRSGGLSASFAERPEALKMRQMVAGFAAAAEQMRRNLSADGSNKTGSRQQLSPLEAFAEKVVSVFDPSALFDNKDEDDLEAEAAAAEAEAANNTRLTRSSLSSSNLKEAAAAGAAGTLVSPSGASWTAGTGSSSSMGSLATQSMYVGFAGAASGSMGPPPDRPPQGRSSPVGSGGSLVQGGRGSPRLGRRSVPVSMHNSPRAAGPGERPPSPAPLIDLEGSSGSPAAGGMASTSMGVEPMPQQQHQQHQQQRLPHHSYLDQLQMPAQQQQQQHSPRSPRDLQAGWSVQQQHPQPRSPRGTRESLIQQFMRPPLSSSGGSLRNPQDQQGPQHINVKAALAAIAPGPLPQPPPPRTRSLVGGHILEANQQHSASSHMQPLRQGLANMSHMQQQQQQQGVPGPAAAPAAPAGSSSSSSVSAHQAAASAAATWDPFAELLTERIASLSGGMAQPPQQQQQQQPPESGVGPLSLHTRGFSAGSEGGVSSVDSLGVGVARHTPEGNSSSSSSSAGSSSEGGAGSMGGVSSTTTPAGATASRGSFFAVEETVSQHQQPMQQHQQPMQQHQQPLQQQATMPEAWLTMFTAGGEAEGAIAAAVAGRGSRDSSRGSSVSLNGGQGGREVGSVSGGIEGSAGLSQLKQAFAQQLMVQHGGTGDELL